MVVQLEWILLSKMNGKMQLPQLPEEAVVSEVAVGVLTEPKRLKLLIAKDILPNKIRVRILTPRVLMEQSIIPE